MRLVLKSATQFNNQRLSMRCDETPCLDSSWHYHAEYELLYISKSSGIRFVGDSVCQFFPGDLVLVGAYLPHLWRNDASYYQEDDARGVQTVVLKFTKDFIGEGTFDLPEFSNINNMLEESKFGLCFGNDTSGDLHKELIDIVNREPVEQSIGLLKLLHKLSIIEDYYPLSSTDMRQFTKDNSDKLDAVIKYISDNYASPIALQDVADIAYMTSNSFCRFFKKKTNKSFTQFLNEVRIRNAARLLIQEDLPVSEICFKVGYQSITNFYRQFRLITGTTPKDYKFSI